MPSHSPRWSLRAPSAEVVAAFLVAQRSAPRLSYEEIGATNDETFRAPGYNLDRNRVRLGQGPEDFAAACAALRAWRMFPAGWTRIHPEGTPLSPGQVVALQIRALGLWWLNAARIVYMIDDEETPALCAAGIARRFGFAYGTLPAHVEQGEERFSVELREDGSVWYDLRAFSRPRFWPVRLAKPVARRLQARFVRESLAAMVAAVGKRNPTAAAAPL